MNLFANRLKQARMDNHLTQGALAEYLGVSRQTINNYESGIREPGLDVLTEISHILNISTDWLLGNDTSSNLFSNNPNSFPEAPIFTQRLRNIRSQKALSQEQVASELGISIGMYQNLEAGQLIPDIVLTNRIAQYLQVSIDWLLGKDTMIEHNQLVPRKYLQEPYGERLRARLILLREMYHYQPEDVAFFLQISPDEYRMFEEGKSDPPVAIMLCLSRLYQLPVESLTIDNSYYIKEMKERFRDL